MSSSDVARSQRILDKIGSRLGLTDCGKEWLIAAADPFHDDPVDCRGYPDVNEAASVVQVVKFSAPISAPIGLGTTENWDAHFHMFPWENNLALIGGNYTNDGATPVEEWGCFLIGNSTTTPGGGVGNLGSAWFGGLAVSTVLSGQVTFDFDGSGANRANSTPFQRSLLPYLSGEYRIIAKGFEVINTTAELNIQGLVTAYRQPCASIDSGSTVPIVDAQALGPGVYQSGFPTVINTAMPPINSAEALLLDGSKQWKAKEGAYIVPTLSADELPAGVNQVAPIMRLSELDPSRGTPPSAGYSYALGTSSSGGQTPPAFQYVPTGSSVAWRPIQLGPAFMQNFNHAGAYFTGLSPTTTLQVNAIYYIERFPTQQDKDLVVLARHSCREDTIARELYAQIIREMPVGVPQRMNGLGEWFADAVSSAADFISPVLGAIPLPQAQVASKMIGTAGGVAKAIMGKKEAPGQTYSAQGANVSAGKSSKTSGVPQKKKKVMKK